MLVPFLPCNEEHHRQSSKNRRRGSPSPAGKPSQAQCTHPLAACKLLMSFLTFHISTCRSWSSPSFDVDILAPPSLAHHYDDDPALVVTPRGAESTLAECTNNNGHTSCPPQCPSFRPVHRRPLDSIRKHTKQQKTAAASTRSHCPSPFLSEPLPRYLETVIL